MGNLFLPLVGKNWEPPKGIKEGNGTFPNQTFSGRAFLKIPYPKGTPTPRPKKNNGHRITPFLSW